MNKVELPKTAVPEPFRSRILSFMGTCEAHRLFRAELVRMLAGAKALIVEAEQEHPSGPRDMVLFYQGAVKGYALQLAAFDKIHQAAEKELSRLESKLDKLQRTNSTS